MGRALPWLKQESSPQPSTSSTCRVRAPQDKASDAEGEGQHASSTTMREKRRRQQIPPSSSPSPSPGPTAERFMREGFDKDDIYMMVEDQLYSVAQSFTQHLHRAEYNRMTDLAKHKNRTTIHDISRPTDASTSMSAETRKMRERQGLSARQKAGLHKMKSDAKRAEVDSDIERDEKDDPWVGTSLHGLMTSPRKTQQALVGLQGVRSTTRAAAGYSKSDAQSPPKRRRLLDLDLSKEPCNSPEKPFEEAEATVSADEDDLDAVPLPHLYNNNRDSRQPSIPGTSNSTQALSRTDIESGWKPRAVKSFAWMDDPDDDLASASAGKDSSRSTAAVLVTSRSPPKIKKEPVTVIPTFLV